MTAIPAQFRVEQVEVVLSHSETPGESFAKDNVILVDPILKQNLSVFGGDTVLKALDLAVVLDVDLHEDVTVALGGHVVGEDQRLDHVIVQIGGHLFGVQSAGKGVLVGGAYYVQLLQL